MLQLVMEIISIVGFVIASLYHLSDIMSVPIAFVGLGWVVVSRFIPPVVDPMAMFWVTYGLLLYQLISFHDFNGCFLEECKTNEMYSYIMLGSTGVFWFSMRESAPSEFKSGAPPEKAMQTIVRAAKPAVVPLEYPAIKIRISNNKSTKPMRLNMGERLQAKWV